MIDLGSKKISQDVWKPVYEQMIEMQTLMQNRNSHYNGFKMSISLSTIVKKPEYCMYCDLEKTVNES